VPYYGGRLTPQMIAGLQPRPAPRPASPLPPPSQPDQDRQLTTLDELRAQGVLSETEYDDLRQRVLGVS
jgi:hypothetical protein